MPLFLSNSCHFSVHKTEISKFLARIHMKYFQMGIFVIPGICLIRKYWSQITAFFLYFSASRGTVSSACHNLFNHVKKHIILNLCLLFPSHALISIPYQKSCDNAKLDAKHSGFVYLFFAKLCSSYLTIFDVIHYLNKTFCRFSEFEL